jgi:hypothetical protein
MMTKMKMMTTSSRIGTLLVTACMIAGALSLAVAQKPSPHPYALIFGTVYGPNDLPARGIKVKIRREGEKKPIELYSDNNGEFAQRFPAGKADYTVWADLKDKQAAEKTQVKVHIDNDERQDVTLHLSK